MCRETFPLPPWGGVYRLPFPQAWAVHATGMGLKGGLFVLDPGIRKCGLWIGLRQEQLAGVLACLLGRRNELCHSSLGCMGVVASFRLRDSSLAVHSQPEPSASGQVTRVPRLALGLEVFLVGFGPVLLGSFTETWSGTARRNQRAPSQSHPLWMLAEHRVGRGCVVTCVCVLTKSAWRPPSCLSCIGFQQTPFPISVKFRGAGSYIKT